MNNNSKKFDQAFTCVGNGHGAPCTPATKEEWLKMRNEPRVAELCQRIENGEDELKHQLPVWTPSCAEFANNHRAIADALKPLPRLMMDFDEKGHTDEIVKALTTQPSPLTVLLIEESARRGTHVLVEVPAGMEPQQAQQLMQQATGFTPDAAVKDISRCIYMVPDDHTRYISEKLFEPTTLSEAPQPEAQPTTTDTEEKLFKGIAYSSIIKEWWKANGGEPQEGERNVKLHKLAVNLRAICDNRKELMMQVMPRFGLTDSELKSIVDSACKEEPKGISKTMQEIIGQLTGLNDSVGDEADNASSTITLLPSAIKRALPPGLKESLIGVPPAMQVPVLCSLMPLIAAYADGVEVEYCDGERQHLGLMTVVRGDQASGKSVCKNAVKAWKLPMDEADEQARKIEDEWRARHKSRKANEKAPEDPKVVIRSVPITISNSTLLRRMKNAQGHTLYSFGEEMDTLTKTNGAGKWSEKYDIYRLAFDRGEWGQDYNSDQAESGVVNVAYNFTVLGTDGAFKKIFKRDNIENGLSSRTLIARMPDSSFAKMPRYGKRSDEDIATIHEAVTKLQSYVGFIDTPRLRKAIDKWEEKKRLEASKSLDHVLDTYRRRAGVIGFRCGVLAMLLEGKETKLALNFAIFMAEYCLQEQIKAFGEMLEEQKVINAKTEGQRYSANHSVFDQLPPVFTIDELATLKRGFCSPASLRKIICIWRADGWVEKIDKSHWRKTSREV